MPKALELSSSLEELQGRSVFTGGKLLVRRWVPQPFPRRKARSPDNVHACLCRDSPILNKKKERPIPLAGDAIGMVRGAPGICNSIIRRDGWGHD